MIWDVFRLAMGIVLPAGFLLVLFVLTVRECVRDYRRARRLVPNSRSAPVRPWWRLLP